MGFLIYPIQGSCSEKGPRIVYSTDRDQRVNMVFYKEGEMLVNYFMDSTRDQVESITLEGLPYGIYDFECHLDQVLVFKDVFRYTNKPTKLAFISCDMLESRSNDEPWTYLKDRELIVHLGDNIYGDPVYKLLSDWIRKTNPSREEIYNYTLKRYSRRYIATFSEWSRVIGRVSHLMGIDDHEVTNDTHKIWDEIDKDLRDGAMESYDRYQSVINGDIVIKRENGRFWSKRYDNFQLLFLDRPYGTRDCFRMEGLDLISEQDMTLIVSLGVAPFTPRYTGDIISEKNEEPEFDDKFYILFDRVREWINKREGRRALIIGGDYHFSCHGKIYIDGEDTGILFACSSPISSQPFSPEYRNATSVLVKEIVNEKYSLRFLEASASRSYIEVNLDEEIILKLVISDSYLPRNMIDYTAYILACT